MKTIILLLLSISAFSQKRERFWLKQSASAATMLVAGFADGQAEIIQSDYRRYAQRHPNANPQWANPKISFRNKYEKWPQDKSAKFPGSTTVLVWTTDKYHLNRTIRNCLVAGNIGITMSLYTKPNWKHIIVQSLSSWMFYAAGTGIAHKYYKPIP